MTFVNALGIFLGNRDVIYLLDIKSHQSQCIIDGSQCGGHQLQCIATQREYQCEQLHHLIQLDRRHRVQPRTNEALYYWLVCSCQSK